MPNNNILCQFFFFLGAENNKWSHFYMKHATDEAYKVIFKLVFPNTWTGAHKANKSSSIYFDRKPTHFHIIFKLYANRKKMIFNNSLGSINLSKLSKQSAVAFIYHKLKVMNWINQNPSKDEMAGKQWRKTQNTCFDNGTALFAFLAALFGLAPIGADDGDSRQSIRHLRLDLSVAQK